MRKKHKRRLIGVGVVLILLSVLYTLALLRSKTRLRRAYAALEADGRPMQGAPLIPPDIPDTENAAPLFLQAARTLKGQRVARWNLLERLATLSSRYSRDSLDEEDLPGRIRRVVEAFLRECRTAKR